MDGLKIVFIEILLNFRNYFCTFQERFKNLILSSLLSIHFSNLFFIGPFNLAKAQKFQDLHE